MNVTRMVRNFAIGGTLLRQTPRNFRGMHDGTSSKHSLAKPRELMGLCVGFLEAEGPLSTKELAQRVLTASGMDTADKVLAHTVACKLIYIMRAQEKRDRFWVNSGQTEQCIRRSRDGRRYEILFEDHNVRVHV